MKAVYLSLGANLGDAPATLREAARRLGAAQGLDKVRLSPLYRTAPQGLVHQPHFINAAIAAETTLEPEDVLALCRSVEESLGRVRTVRWGPRNIDIDILLVGDAVRDTAELTLPHPRMLERAFVLRPLLDLAPDLSVNGVSLQARILSLADQAVEPLGF